MTENHPRKSRTAIWLKTCWVFFLITMPFCLFLNFVGIPFPIPVVIILAFILGTWTTVVQWAFVTIAMNIWYRNDPRYHKWKYEGGRPYWDTVVWPVGPWSKSKYPPIEQETGMPEPEYTYFTPPDHWRFQCPKCGVRLQFNPDVCWNCSYGADGDSTACYERLGIKPPNSRS